MIPISPGYIIWQNKVKTKHFIATQLSMEDCTNSTLRIHAILDIISTQYVTCVYIRHLHFFQVRKDKGREGNSPLRSCQVSMEIEKYILY